MSALLVAQCWGYYNNGGYASKVEVDFGDSREIMDMWGYAYGLCVKFKGDRPNLKCVEGGDTSARTGFQWPEWNAGPMKYALPYVTSCM